MSRCLEALEARGGNSYKCSVKLIKRKKKKVVKDAGKIPLGRADDTHFRQ